MLEASEQKQQQLRELDELLADGSGVEEAHAEATAEVHAESEHEEATPASDSSTVKEMLADIVPPPVSAGAAPDVAPAAAGP